MLPKWQVQPQTMQSLLVKHRIKASLADLSAHYKAHPDDAKKLILVGDAKADAAVDASTLAAWTMLANELMNLDEVLNK